MKKIIIPILTMSVLVLFLLSVYGTSSGRTTLAEETAQYKITFTSTWSNETHPWENFPGGAHFSRLVGATHNQGLTIWQRNGIATDGIKDMAERGNNTNLKNEVEAAIAATTSDQYISGNSLGTATGVIVLESVDVHPDYPLLTLVSMIAPSPDWFVGVSSVPLIENGEWIATKEINLFPYDAGTDDGIDYDSGNAPSNPRQPIANISGEAPFSDQPIGTLTIVRINIPEPTDTPVPADTSTPTATNTPTVTMTLTPPATPSPTSLPCPLATPEQFRVNYISPTDLTTQTLVVRIGNGDAVTIKAPSGVYTATGTFGFAAPAQVEVGLLADQDNAMTVAVHVRPVRHGECTYGNYTLTTKVSIRHQSSATFRVYAPVVQ